MARSDMSDKELYMWCHMTLHPELGPPERVPEDILLKWFKKRYRSKQSGASKKKILLSITTNDIVDIYNKQSGRCLLTGFSFYPTNDKYSNLSFDRINPGEGYVKENIRLVTWWANIARSTMSDEEFREWCGRVVSRK